MAPAQTPIRSRYVHPTQAQFMHNLEGLNRSSPLVGGTPCCPLLHAATFVPVSQLGTAHALQHTAFWQHSSVKRMSDKPASAYPRSQCRPDGQRRRTAGELAARAARAQARGEDGLPIGPSSAYTATGRYWRDEERRREPARFKGRERTADRTRWEVYAQRHQEASHEAWNWKYHLSGMNGGGRTGNQPLKKPATAARSRSASRVTWEPVARPQSPQQDAATVTSSTTEEPAVEPEAAPPIRGKPLHGPAVVGRHVTSRQTPTMYPYEERRHRRFQQKRRECYV